MRVVVWGINYAPEVTGIGPCNTALCEHLRDAGHEVEMVTTFQYYPAWKKNAEDRGRIWRTDRINGIPVHRCWHYVPETVTKLKRIIHEATFVATSFARLATCPRADVIVAVSPPLLLGAAAWLASKITGSRYVFHVQDLQPDAAIGLGMLKPSAFTRLLYALESFAYRHACRVSGISRGMLAAFYGKGVPGSKCLLFPNGIALDSLPSVKGEFRKLHGLAADDFLAVYSGNIGVKQGLEGLVDGARRVTNPRVRIFICGDGAQRREIERRAEGLTTVKILPLLPQAKYRAMLADADLAVITQTAGSGRSFFPSKLLPAFGAALPVLSVADEESELARALQESGGGLNVLPNQPHELARALDRLADAPSVREAYAKAGRAWVEQFEVSRLHAAFIEELETAIR